MEERIVCLYWQFCERVTNLHNANTLSTQLKSFPNQTPAKPNYWNNFLQPGLYKNTQETKKLQHLISLATHFTKTVNSKLWREDCESPPEWRDASAQSRKDSPSPMKTCQETGSAFHSESSVWSVGWEIRKNLRIKKTQIVEKFFSSYPIYIDNFFGRNSWNNKT
jgi:hypothetical protein